MSGPAYPDLGFLRRRPRRQATTTPGTSAPSPATPSPTPARPPANRPPANRPPAPPAPRPEATLTTPAQPGLRFLRRRARRDGVPDLVRTGNAALDLSDGGLRVGASGSAPVTAAAADVSVLRGRTVLDENHPVVRIGGEQAISGSLQLTLSWSGTPHDQRQLSAGLRSRGTDIHLGCLWETNDRQAGALQELGGGPDAAPGIGSTILRLTGRSETEWNQTLTVSLRHVADLKRLVAYVYAFGAAPEWDSLAPVLSATLRGGVSVVIPLGTAPAGATTCAVGSLHRVGGVLVLRREAMFLPGPQQQVAEEFGWHLPWAAGRTLPPVHHR